MNQKLFLASALSSSFVSLSLAVPAPLVDVPVAITPLSSQQLQTAPVNSIDQLMNVPGSLRPVFTDRGIASPVTVGTRNLNVGWMTAYSFQSQNYSGGSSFNDQFVIGTPVLEIGLLNNLDLLVQPPSYQINNYFSKSPFFRNFNRDTGWTDFSLGLKYSVLAGKDGYGWDRLGSGAIAWSISADITFPTASRQIMPSDNYFGGLTSELGYTFSTGWQIRMNNGFELWRDNHDWNAGFRNDFALYTPDIGPVNIYAGFRSTVTTVKNSDWQGYANVGVIYKPKRDFQVFFETGIDVNESHPEIRFATGIDWRYHGFDTTVK